MRERSLLIICILIIIAVAGTSTALILNNSHKTEANNTTNNTNTTNLTLNNSTNNTTTQTTSTTKTTKTSKNTDPDYDASRDASHKYASESNPITVQQSDGEYTYYGPGHYDYYAGANHMSGEYYKDRKYNPQNYR